MRGGIVRRAASAARLPGREKVGSRMYRRASSVSRHGASWSCQFTAGPVAARTAGPVAARTAGVTGTPGNRFWGLVGRLPGVPVAAVSVFRAVRTSPRQADACLGLSALKRSRVVMPDGRSSDASQTAGRRAKRQPGRTRSVLSLAPSPLLPATGDQEPRAARAPLPFHAPEPFRTRPSCRKGMFGLYSYFDENVKPAWPRSSARLLPHCHRDAHAQPDASPATRSWNEASLSVPLCERMPSSPSAKPI